MRFPGIWIIALFAFNGFGQLPVGRDTITVIENTVALKSGFAGGLNSCMFSQIDLDQDGKKDLVTFDRINSYAFGKIKCFLNKGSAGETKYIYDPKYESKFPAVEQWALFYDYNNDGRSDLFTYHVTGGIKVYQNTSTGGNLSFQSAKSLLLSNITPTSSPTLSKIFASNTAGPGISDIDNDGDLDILTFSSTGFQIEYHKNKSMELYSSADSLVFELSESSWGNISENNCSVTLNQFLAEYPSENSPFKTYHAGACLMCFDRDGDGDKDLLMGDVACNKMNYCENGGTVSNAHITDTTKLYPNFPLKASTQVIKLNTFPCSYHLDVDNDNKKDLIACPTTVNSENWNSVWFYKNNSTSSAVDFQFVKNNFIQEEMIDCGEGAYPVLFDADVDGLADLIIGNYGYYFSSAATSKTRLTYYKNTGSLSQPSYSLVTRDYANLSTLSGTVALINMVPAFGDIDGDGDQDMLIGEVYGKIHWVENTAGAGMPCNFSVFKNDPFGINAFSGSPFPQLIDVDRDNLLDLIIGLRNGKLAYYRNTGTSTAPSFSLITNTFGNVNVKGFKFSLEGNCAPFMYDDGGVYKLLCGSVGGEIFNYDNIDGNLNGNFNRLDTNVNKINDGPQSAIQYSDINGDGKRDLIVGNYAGGLSFYSSKNPIGIKETTGKDEVVLVYPNPAMDLFTVKIESAETIEVEVSDLTGRSLSVYSCQCSSLPISTAPYQKGIYLIKVASRKGKEIQSTVRKIILQ
jgi:hypothetical protein